MKKSLKIILISIGFVILLIGIDIGSILLIKKPIFAIKDDCDCLDRVYRGVLYDTYNCWEYPSSQIKFKWTKFSCEKDVIVGKITEIKDNYIVITILKNNLSIKINEEAHISLSNNPTIKGANNLIIGQYIQIKPNFIQETYPVMITTDKIDIVDKSDIEDTISN